MECSTPLLFPWVFIPPSALPSTTHITLGSPSGTNSTLRSSLKCSFHPPHEYLSNPWLFHLVLASSSVILMSIHPTPGFPSGTNSTLSALSSSTCPTLCTSHEYSPHPWFFPRVQTPPSLLFPLVLAPPSALHMSIHPTPGFSLGYKLHPLCSSL